MRARLLVASALAGVLSGCGTSEAPAAAASDGAVDAEGQDVDARINDSTPAPFWDSTPPPDQPDTSIGPVGHCLYDSIDWTCRSGHICTFFGKCAPDDAGPSEAGSEACGIVWCDKGYCRCRTASASLCDCN